jgi:hypothetical protein
MKRLKYDPQKPKTVTQIKEMMVESKTVVKQEIDESESEGEEPCKLVKILNLDLLNLVGYFSGWFGSSS